MECDVCGEFLGKDRRRSEVPSNDDALTSGEVLDDDLVNGKVLENGSKLLHAK